MKFEDFKIGQEYQVTKNILIMGDLDIGQRNAYFPQGIRLIVSGSFPNERIVAFREKNSGVGIDLYPSHPCMQDSLHLIEDVENITLVPVDGNAIPNCPNCNGQREQGDEPHLFNCFFCGQLNRR